MPDRDRHTPFGLSSNIEKSTDIPEHRCILQTSRRRDLIHTNQWGYSPDPDRDRHTPIWIFKKHREKPRKPRKPRCVPLTSRRRHLIHTNQWGYKPDSDRDRHTPIRSLNNHREQPRTSRKHRCPPQTSGWQDRDQTNQWGHSVDPDRWPHTPILFFNKHREKSENPESPDSAQRRVTGKAEFLQTRGCTDLIRWPLVTDISPIIEPGVFSSCSGRCSCLSLCLYSCS